MASRTTRTAPLFLAGAVALGLAACSGGGAAPGDAGASGSAGTPQRGGTLTVALASVPPTIDPYATSLQAAWTTARQACEPLFDVDDSYQVKPMLVDKYTYDGKLTYTLDLRPEVTFQNGAPLTPEDVIASLDRYFETPGNGSILKGLTASMKATGPHQLTITLTKSSAIVPTLLTTAFIMPASIVKGRPATDALSTLVCTGPYKVTSFTPDTGITLQRWDGYKSRTETSSGYTGAKHAYADTIVLTPFPEASTRLQAVQTGQADIASALPLDDYAQLKEMPGVNAILTDPASNPAAVFNKDAGPMSNVLVRRAFLAALDMDSIMQAGFGNSDLIQVDGAIIPSANKTWFTDAGLSGHYNQKNVDAAKALLQQAGYDGQQIVWMTTKDDNSWYAPVLPAVEQLKKAGFNIKVDAIDQATLISRRTDPTQFDVFSSAYPVYADPLLVPYLQSTFPGHWTDPQKDQLLQQLTTEPDASKRKALWEQLQTLVYTDVPMIKFGSVRALVATTERTHLTSVDTESYYNDWVQGS